MSVSFLDLVLDFPGGASGKEPACQCGRPQRHRLESWRTTDGGAWQAATVVSRSRRDRSDLALTKYSFQKNCHKIIYNNLFNPCLICCLPFQY